MSKYYFKQCKKCTKWNEEFVHEYPNCGCNMSNKPDICLEFSPKEKEAKEDET